MGRPGDPNGSGTTCDIWGVQSGDFGADRSGGAPIAALYALRGVTGNKPPDSALDIRDIVDRDAGFRGGFGRGAFPADKAKLLGFEQLITQNTRYYLPSSRLSCF